MPPIASLEIAALLLGTLATAIGAILWRARRRAALPASRGATSEPASVPALIVRPLPPPAPRGGMAALALNAFDERAAPPTLPGGGERRCPSCAATYPAWMTVCALDATPLPEPAPPAPPRDRRALDRMRCSQCERRYVRGATHCAFDAAPLEPDAVGAARRARGRTVCRACGEDAEGRELACGCAEPDHAIFDPSELRPTPFSPARCPQCGALGAPSTIFCEHDGELLLPADGVSERALPRAGFGPKRSICSSCGRRASRAYKFCTYDGQPLLIMQ